MVRKSFSDALTFEQGHTKREVSNLIKFSKTQVLEVGINEQNKETKMADCLNSFNARIKSIAWKFSRAEV